MVDHVVNPRHCFVAEQSRLFHDLLLGFLESLTVA